jgi:[NiFe] hydrogenase assembly HybE family chaperone
MTQPADDSHPPVVVVRLLDAYAQAAVRMRPLPQYNAALDVEAVGFREYRGRQVGVIVTPWFMNLTVLPASDEQPPWHAGRITRLDFPSGPYDLMVGEAEGVGLIATTSLFSLMHDFADAGTARATARAAVDALFESLTPTPPPEPKPERVFSRRRLFGG